MRPVAASGAQLARTGARETLGTQFSGHTLGAAWTRYSERVKAITAADMEKPVLVKVFNALEHQAKEIAEISKSL